MKIKRFTSIFLAFTLLLSVFSVSAFSQEKEAFEPKVYSNANIDEGPTPTMFLKTNRLTFVLICHIIEAQ